MKQRAGDAFQATADLARDKFGEAADAAKGVAEGTVDQIQSQAEHFGIGHENVISSCGALYQDTISTFKQRIQVQGDSRFLQQPANASKIRGLLLAGIRSARLWRQLGGHRWQLVFSRRKLLRELYPMLRG